MLQKLHMSVFCSCVSCVFVFFICTVCSYVICDTLVLWHWLDDRKGVRHVKKVLLEHEFFHGL